MIGQRIGHYEIVEELGKGGMATVYRAYDPRTDRFVALKIIHQNLTRVPGDMERFRHEAQLISKLEHPHLLPVYDYSADHDPPYIVMRYLEGGSLKEIMESRVRLPLSEIAHLMRQVCAALDYAHRRNVIHRDIKPGNIMVDEEGNAYLTDFGIARVITMQGITQTGIAIGTPGYMSPEQGYGLETVDHRADIYALGVLIFELAVGIAPFSAPTPMGLMLKHIQDPVPSIHDIVTDLPAGLDALIQKAMAKEPADRYGSAKELSDALVALAGSSASTDTPELLKAAAMMAVQRAEYQRDTGAIQALMAKFERERAGTPLPPIDHAATLVGRSAVDTPTQQQPAERPPYPAAPPGRQRQGRLSAFAVPGMLALAVVVLIIIAGTVYLLLPAPTRATPTVNSTQIAEATASAFVPSPAQPTRTPVVFEPTPTPPDNEIILTTRPELEITPSPTTQPELEDTPSSAEPLSPIEQAAVPVSSNADWTGAFPQGFGQDFDGVPMVLVPAGCFAMGDDPEGFAWNGVEYAPVVPDGGEQCFETPFWMDKYEVSNEQFNRLGGQAAAASTFNAPQRPRETISWFEARDFCTRRGARLPTEAEWEYAARGPDGLYYPWGDTFVAANTVYESNANGQTADVGSHPGGASWVGAMDMGGNVFEWVSSRFAPYPYRSDDGREELADPSGVLRERILRGGSWGNIDLGTRSAGRGGLSPANQTHFGGFRCARDVVLG